MNISPKKLFFSIAASIGLVIISYFIMQNVFYVSTDNAQVEGHAVLLAPKISGYITKVNVIQGQKVKKGDILVEIDDRDYQNTLKQAKSNLISLEAKLRDSERNFRRSEKLYKSGATTQQQYDSSFANYTDNKAQFDSVYTQVLQAELILEFTKITAPINGIIAKSSVELGQFASPGVPLIGFVDSDERWITANFKETDIESIRIGSNAQIEVDAISSKKYDGSVYSISSATGATFTLLPPDNATGNFTKVVQRVPVRIKLEKLSEKDIELLRSGLSAIVKIKKSSG
ncbi:HlyD family secretion protein [Fluviispira sanaruensis]|uniref:Multidrug resistance protein MdtA-like barrel-sandwich hybrid domain-containing protein n=1 Tax=Fluviispira sanaruensis TaxID=2493639 RepID=A0A4P2VJJ2_FLUSA|nr:HlyD family secretion protein [Fluviispira sanaruensis]BBH51750.1 hypothetical protein JCM31447_01670 [Fluviispira sanaruensis]